MSDQLDRVRDDAPVTTSKEASGKRALLAEAMTINRPREELYAFWRDFTNLVSFMDNIEAIEVIDATRSRWRVKAPAGRTVEWESVVSDDRPGESISWQSVEGSQIANSGKIEFQDAGARGTVVRAAIAYEPPAGIIGQVVAKLFQREPRLQTRRDLRRFKQLMETGEIATAARTKAMLVEERE
jgi:uncharacterized membrane protein